MNFIIFAAVAFLLTYGGVKIFLDWSKKNQILDLPNDRSSHLEPTPVGGGVVIVSVSLALLLAYLYLSGSEIPWSYFAGAVLIASVSWFDDLYSMPAWVRFLCHGAAALFVILGLGVIDNITLPSIGNFYFGEMIYVLWFLWIVWLVNAYNFMDGIDGIAGLQAVTAGLSWALVGYFQGIGVAAFYGAILAFSAAGFLLHNWQPAKVFMGDVGSSFFGYTFAVFPLFLAGRGTREGSGTFLLVSALFVWLFVFDSLRTFLIRLLKGEPVWRAHRNHLYQKLVIKGFSHQFVTLLYGGLSALISGLTLLRVYFGVANDVFLYSFLVLISIGLLLFVVYLNKTTYAK